YNQRIRKLTPSGALSTVAGDGTRGSSGTGSALTSSLQFPIDVTVTAAGDFYIDDQYNHVIKKVTPSGVMRIIAGSDGAGFGGDGKPASSGQLNYPSGLALDAGGNLYIVDQYNRRIRKVT